LLAYNCPDVSDGINPGQHTIAAAITARDTPLLRKIAKERKDLTDQQREALALVADLLEEAGKRPDQC